jgi:hypothetical protein
MELQFGLAIVDEMNGGKETRQRLNGWMNGESKMARRLRSVGAKALVALAARLSPEVERPVVVTPVAGVAQS